MTYSYSKCQSNNTGLQEMSHSFLSFNLTGIRFQESMSTGNLVLEIIRLLTPATANTSEVFLHTTCDHSYKSPVPDICGIPCLQSENHHPGQAPCVWATQWVFPLIPSALVPDRQTLQFWWEMFHQRSFIPPLLWTCGLELSGGKRWGGENMFSINFCFLVCTTDAHKGPGNILGSSWGWRTHRVISHTPSKYSIIVSERWAPVTDEMAPPKLLSLPPEKVFYDQQHLPCANTLHILAPYHHFSDEECYVAYLRSEKC